METAMEKWSCMSISVIRDLELHVDINALIVEVEILVVIAATAENGKLVNQNTLSIKVSYSYVFSENNLNKFQK